MNIPQGYKSSPLGIIPKDWEVKRLGEVCVNAGEYGLNAPAVDYNPALPTYLRITDIDVDGTFIQSDKKSVMVDNAQNYYLLEGDIVFARTGATVGKSYLYNPQDGKLVFAGFLIRFSPDKNKIVPYYIKCLTETIAYHNWVSTISTRSGQPGINAQEYASFQFPLPPLAEQERIAELLGTWDKAIEMQKQLIDKLELRKKGLMQQLLTGKKRLKGFTEPWVEKQLCEVFDFFKGNGLSKEKICPDGIYKCMLYGEIFTQFNYITRGQFHRTNYNEGFLSKSGDVLMPGSTTTNGYDLVKAVAINQDNIFLGGDIIILRKRDIRDDSLFWATLISEIERQKIAEKTQGITIIHLHAKNLMDIKYKVPTLYTEQTAIANVLSALDNEIQKQTEKRDKYIEEKKGLMQVLLTGKKRI